MTILVPVALATVAIGSVACGFGAENGSGGASSTRTPTATAAPQIEDPPLPTAPAGGDTPVVATPGTGPTAEPTAEPTLPPDSDPEAAPIDGLDVLVLESFPPQYIVHIQAGLPSGCASQYRHDVERRGNEVTIIVLNAIKRADFCTAIYGIYEINVNLGSNFVSGETYTVTVNGVETQFTAQ